MRRNLSGRMKSISFGLIACTVLAIVFFGGVRAMQKEKKTQVDNKQALRIQMQRGLGKEVRLATAQNSFDGVRDSINSISDFIEGRSGLKLSENVKYRLASMEHQTLSGKSRRLSVAEAVEVLTETVEERLSTLSDKEIERIAATLSEGDYVVLRASGRGTVPVNVFADRLKTMRELSRQKDDKVKNEIRAAVNSEVDRRLQVLSDALPERWRKAYKQGLTPTQITLIAYSVASDDPMGHSQQTLRATQELLHSKMKYKGYKQGRKPGVAFGSEGYLFSTPLEIVLGEATMGGLMSRIEERGAR